MIDLPVNALETLKRLFAKYMPHCEVRAFGSRVKWTSKDYSDLDIAIVCDEPIERKLFNRLKEEIEEIPISFRVDLLDWHKISPQFQRIIEEQYEIIYTETSQNSDEWKYYKVDEFAEIVGGGTPKTDIATYWNGSIPWLTPKDLSGYTNRFISHGERYISAEGLKNSSAKIVPAGTVLLTSRAPVGYVAIAKSEACTNQGFRSLIPKEGFDSEFIYYLLFHNTEYLKSHATGTTFQELSGGSLKNLSFQIPSLKTQKNIVRILGSLDDKIALNREMNKTLESMAQAIFKSYFVDFESFKEGEFVESELGMIPKGWEVGQLGDNIKIIDNRGKTPPICTEVTEYPIIEVNALSGDNRTVNYSAIKKYVSEETYNSWFRAGHPKKNDILLSTVGSVGEVAMFPDNRGSIAQNVVALRAINTSPYYLYQALVNMKDKLKGLDIGSVQPSIKVTQMTKIHFLWPEQHVLEKFDSHVENFVQKIHLNETEIEALSQVRDTLLPKLLSGEMEV